jgi:hypothetical protein
MMMLQANSSMAPGLSVLLVAVMIVAVVVGWFATRPLRPILKGLVASNKNRFDLISGIICVLWGGGVWLLIIRYNQYDNVFGIVMASMLICVGLYSLVKRLLKRDKS